MELILILLALIFLAVLFPHFMRGLVALVIIVIVLFFIYAQSSAQAAQMLIPGPGGLRYSRPFQTQPYYQPGPYYQPFPGPYYQRGGPFPPPIPPSRPLPPPSPFRGTATVMVPPPDATDEIAETNPQGITRAEVEEAIADFCTRNADAPLCVKLRAKGK